LSCSASLSAATFTVRINDNDYTPKNLTVAPGDTVIWTNFGGDHTVTADNGAFSSTTAGGYLDQGETFTHTFAAAGRFPYYCLLHGGPGGQDMSGTIRVVEPGDNFIPATPSNISPASNATNQSTSPTLSASPFSDANADDTHIASQWLLRDAGTNSVVFDSGEDPVMLTSIPLADLDAATAFSWQVRYKDDRGGWSEYSAQTQFTTAGSSGQPGTGLLGTYGSYNRTKNAFTPRVTQTDSVINFDWGFGRPHRQIAPNNFMVRWEGSVLPAFSETYRFRSHGDGGVRLWVNGQLIIDDWVVCKFPVYRNSTASLQSGVPANIKLEYFDTGGKASVALRWSSPSLPVEWIPQSRLYPPQ
jgi:plastocyanin